MKVLVITLALTFLALSYPMQSYAVIEAVEFDNPSHEARYRTLIDELRCLVCQNQNLAGSDAPLAKDLREITANMLKSGSSDKEIKAFMRERYGDFVLYEPPFNAATAFLWLGPFILLLGVLIAIIMTIKRKQNDELFKPTHAMDEAERVRVRNLLSDTPELDSNLQSKRNSE